MALSIISATTSSRKYAGNTSSLTVTLNQTPTIGNILVVGFVTGTGTNPTFSDNQIGNSYVLVNNEQIGATANVFLYYSIITNASGTFTLTASNIGNLNYDIFVYEVAGVNISNPYTSGNSLGSTGTTNSSGQATIGSLTNTTNNAIFFTIFNDNGSSGTFTPGNGWTVDLTNGRDINTAWEGGLDYLIVSNINPISQTLTASHNQPFNAVIACFNGYDTPVAPPPTDYIPSLRDSSIPTISIPKNDLSMKMTIAVTDALLADQGYTYNQPGFTYNQAGWMYGGVYNANEDVVPTFSNIVLKDSIHVTASTTDALLADQGYTYNQPGFTYNQAGWMYGGVYNYNEYIIPLDLTFTNSIPVIMKFSDIYSNNTPPPQGNNQSIGPGFFMFITH